MVIVVLAAWVVLPINAAAVAQQQKKAPDIKQQLLSHPEKIPALLKKGKITLKDIPNPHWKKNACVACHKGKASAKKQELRNSDVDKLCNTCHASLSEHSYIHVSDIKLPRAMQKRMPKSFRKAVKRGGNKMTCITCHDLPMTCKQNRYKEKGPNPLFFRGGPYESRTGLCYHCHNKKKYQRVNAHEQISASGKLLSDKCLICHKTTAGLAGAKSSENVDFNLKQDLSRLCWGCHRWKPHPGGSFTFFSGKGGTPNHLVKPSSQIMDRMQEMQKRMKSCFLLNQEQVRYFAAPAIIPINRVLLKQRCWLKAQTVRSDCVVRKYVLTATINSSSDGIFHG